MIQIGRWSSGFRGFLSPPLNRGLRSDFNQASDENPLSKHTLKSLCKSLLADWFFRASFGTYRNALPSLALSIALATSWKLISQFNIDESKDDFSSCSAELSVSNYAFRFAIFSKKSSSYIRSGSSLIPLKHSEKS